MEIKGIIMKAYVFSHQNEEYSVNLKWLATRNMGIKEARDHIDTDSMVLTKGMTARELKDQYKVYLSNGGKLSKSDYLSKEVTGETGYHWDEIIKLAKNEMRNLYNSQNTWETEEDHIKLTKLALAGHSLSAFTLGHRFMQQDKPGDETWAVRFLVNAHNYGNVSALYVLSGYLAKKSNHKAALACLVIAADWGSDCASVSIPHPMTMRYLAEAASEDGTIIDFLTVLADTSRYSTARYLLLMLYLVKGEMKAVSLFNDIIHCPQNPPKEFEEDPSYLIRSDLLKRFFSELKIKLVSDSGSLMPMPAVERMAIYNKTAKSEEFHWCQFSDYLELDDYFNPTIEAL